MLKCKQALTISAYNVYILSLESFSMVSERIISLQIFFFGCSQYEFYFKIIQSVSVCMLIRRM